MSYQGAGLAGIMSYLTGTFLPGITRVRIQNIYGSETPDAQLGYPSVMIATEDLPSTTLDNSRNRKIFGIRLTFMIDRKTAGVYTTDSAEILMSQLGDEVTKKLDSDFTLGNTCIFHTHEIKFGYADGTSNNIRVAEVQLKCTDANTWRT